VAHLWTGAALSVPALQSAFVALWRSPGHHENIPTIEGEAMESSVYGIVHFFPGGTREQYEASLAAAHPGKGLRPDGQIFHAAGSSPGGWTIMAIHESKESWEQFRDNILLPRLQEGVQGGFTTMPEETVIDVYNYMP
jgi:hypothetical protein